MKKKHHLINNFIVFSIVLFFFILVAGSTAFILKGKYDEAIYEIKHLHANSGFRTI